MPDQHACQAATARPQRRGQEGYVVRLIAEGFGLELVDRGVDLGSAGSGGVERGGDGSVIERQRVEMNAERAGEDGQVGYNSGESGWARNEGLTVFSASATSGVVRRASSSEYGVGSGFLW